MGSIAILILLYREPRVGGKRISTLLAQMNNGNNGDFPPHAESLLRAAGPEAIPPLIRALNRTNSPYRDGYNSLRAKMPGFLLRLMPESQDRAICRVNAASLLASVGPAAKPAIPQLRKLLGDENTMVRFTAARTLGSIGQDAREAVADLLPLLESNDACMRLVAAEALFKIDPNEHEAAATQVFVSAIGRGYYLTQTAISRLQEMGKADLVVPALIEALKPENHYRSRTATAMSLGQLGPLAKAAVPSLTEALFDEHAGVRSIAAQALGEIGPEARSALPALYEAANQPQAAPGAFEIAIRKIEGTNLWNSTTSPLTPRTQARLP